MLTGSGVNTFHTVEKKSNVCSPAYRTDFEILRLQEVYIRQITNTKLNNTTYPFPKRQILDSSKLKEFADNNFRFDGNGRKFSKRVENTV